MGPMILMAHLVDNKGKNLIPGVSNPVTLVTHGMYKTKLTLEASATDVGAEHLLDCCGR